MLHAVGGDKSDNLMGAKAAGATEFPRPGNAPRPYLSAGLLPMKVRYWRSARLRTTNT